MQLEYGNKMHNWEQQDFKFGLLMEYQSHDRIEAKIRMGRACGTYGEKRYSYIILVLKCEEKTQMGG
jgi:hypothetical protein